MGLITKEVEILISAKNVKHLESKGYEIPKIKNKNGKLVFQKNIKILVNVIDLQNGSHAEIDIECDCCEKLLNNIKWKDYLRCVKEDGKYYCLNCALKTYVKDKANKTKLKNGKSFEQWCINNDRQDVLKRWDYELNDLLPSETTHATANKYYFKCPKNIHKSELKNIRNFTSGEEGVMNCNQCNSFAQYNIDNLDEKFLEKYWYYEKNTIDPWDISYGSKKFVYIKCQEKDYHGSYNITCSDFVNGYRCGYCKCDKLVHPLDSIGKLLKDNNKLNLWSNINKKSPYEYSTHSGQEVYWKCPEGKHEDYPRSINSSNRSDIRCPECTQEKNESILQEKVRLYINNIYNFTLLHENKCTIKCINPKSKQKLLFDNEVKELKLIIEIHGVQHYEINWYHYLQAKHNNTTPEQELHYQKVKDRYKRMFAKSKINNYHYLEIPYYTNDKKETWKKLIDDNIDYIIKLKYIEDKNKIA